MAKKKKASTPIKLVAAGVDNLVAQNNVRVDVSTDAIAPVDKNMQKNDKNNAVRILDGKNVVRVYSFEDHGDKYRELAYSFANYRGYSAEDFNTDTGVLCPSCGHRFNK